MQNCIAERKLVYLIKETGELKDLTIRIGTPIWHHNEELASCAVEWDGLFDNFADAKGIDTLQAIHMASDIDPLLKLLQNKYDFFWPTGERYFDEE
jgi:hypothetical protein